MTQSQRTASCSCGQLNLVCHGNPARISMCHCYECQKRTGSAFGVQARFKEEDVRISGVSSTWARTGDSGGHATFHFCPTCAAIVYWQADGLKGFLSVAVGAFQDATFPPPTVSVYESRRHQWIEAPSLILEKWD